MTLEEELRSYRLELLEWIKEWRSIGFAAIEAKDDLTAAKCFHTFDATSSILHRLDKILKRAELEQQVRVKNGVCLDCGEGVLQSGEHITGTYEPCASKGVK